MINMSEIDIDMSKCLFIFSYNEEHKVNKILRDHACYETSGYNTEDKIISKEFLIPTIEKNLCLKNDFVFNNEIINISLIIRQIKKKEYEI